MALHTVSLVQGNVHFQCHTLSCWFWCRNVSTATAKGVCNIFLHKDLIPEETWIDIPSSFKSSEAKTVNFFGEWMFEMSVCFRQ